MYRFMRELHPVDDAISLLYGQLEKMIMKRRTDILSAVGSYSASRIESPSDLPAYDKSVVDGCAARTMDIGGASPEAPVILRRKGVIKVDDNNEYFVERGECYEVATGSRIPANADVVIPAEYLEFAGDTVVVTRNFESGYGISTKGEDLRKGTTILLPGERIDDYHIGLLAASGYYEIDVWKLPRTCVFSTGDELIEPGKPFEAGKTYASTGYLVSAILRKLGYDVEYLGIVGDDKNAIKDMFERLLYKCPIVVSTGGTSVGKRDNVIKVVSEDFSDKGFLHGIALTPGRPMGIGVTRITGKHGLIIALSGMPVAAYTEIVAVVEPALAKALGRSRRIFREFSGILARKLVSRPGMTNYVRASTKNVNGKIVASPLRLTGSGILSTLLKGDSMIIVPPEVTGYNEGDVVQLISTRL